jgi:hypothetical protein
MDQQIKDMMILDMNTNAVDSSFIADQAMQQDQSMNMVNMDQSLIDQTLDQDQTLMNTDQNIEMMVDQSLMNIDQSISTNVDMQIASCIEDRFVPNQQFAQARSLTEGIFDELMLCEATEDWYRLDVCAQGAVLAEVRFNHDLGDLDIELYDQNQVLVDQGATLSSNELALYESAITQPMYLKVKGKTPEQSNHYSINYFTSNCRECQRQSDCTNDTVCDQGKCVLGGCADDILEDNDQSDMASALQATQNDLKICGADEDWYKIDLCAGGDLIVVAYFNQFQNLDLFLYTGNPQNLTQVDQGTSSVNNGDEIVVYSSNTVQSLYLKAIGVNTGELAYSLEVDISGCL